MKAAAKQSFSLFLCLVMLAGLFPGVSHAEDARNQPEMETSADTRVQASDTLGQVFANSLDLSGDLTGEESSSNSVSDLTVTDGKVTVTYRAAEEAELVVAFYEDPGAEEAPALKLLATATAPVDGTGTAAELDLPEGLPEYYLVGVYLLRSATHEPLCEEFTCSLYTKLYQDFIHAPLSDYEDTGERLLVLDEGTEEDGTDASFAVFAEDVVLVKETAEANHLTANADGSFTFTEPDETLLALRSGDKLAHTALDGSVTVILVQSRSLDEASGTLTLSHDAAAEAPVFFSTVRIDTAEDPDAEPIVDMSTAAPGVEYLPDESVSGEVQRIIADIKAGGEAPLYAGTDSAVVMEPVGEGVDLRISQELSYDVGGAIGTGNANVKAFGKLSLCPELSIKFYLSDELNYIFVSARMTVSFHGGFEGTLTGEIPIGKAVIPTGIPGLEFSIEPKMILEFQCNLTYVTQYTFAAGVDYDNRRARGDQFRTIWEAPHVEGGNEVRLEGTLRFGLRGEIGAEYTLIPGGPAESCLLKASLSATSAIELEGSQTVASLDDSEIHDCRYCIDGTIQLAQEFGYELSAGFGLLSWANDSVLRQTKPLGSFYFSLDNLEAGSGRCPHRQYRLTVTAVDGRDYSLAELALLDPEQLIRDSNLAHRVPDCVLSIQDRSGKSVQSEDLITDGNGNVSVFLPSGEYTLTGYTDELYGTAGLRIDNAPRETGLLLAAAETESGTAGALTWVFYPQSGLLAISGSGNMDDYAASGDGAAPWAAYRDRVKTVILRPGVKSVGENAFRSFRKLSSVQLPAGCASIGANAFRDLTRLDSVTIPKTVELVGQNAFSGCKALRRVVYDGSMSQWKDLKKNGIKSGNEPLLNAELVLTSTVIDKGQCGDALFWTLNSAGMLTISGTGAMYDYAPSEIPWADYRDLITGLSLEYGVSSLCASAFSGCAKLAELSIPEGLNSLGASAFSGCTGLSRVELPDGLTSIPGGCFRNCRSLSAINLPYSLRSIGQDAFAGCNMGTRKSKDIFYEGTDNEWNSRVSVASGNDPLLRVLTTYSDELFASGSCGENLTWYLTKGGALVLEGYGELTSNPWKNVTIADVIYPASKIYMVRLPEGISSICDSAFSGLSGLQRITVPDTVQEIGEKVFSGCSNLTSLTVPFVGASREDSRSLGYFFSPAFVLETSGKTYQAYNLPDRLSTVRVTDATEIAEEAFYAYVYRSSYDRTRILHLSSIILNDGVTAIGANAFRDQSELVSFHLPDSLTTIGDHPFSGCSKLQSFDFPENMTQIPDYLFAGCGLLEFAIPAQVTSIGTGAFQGCGKLSTFSIPPRVTVIGPYAFSNCSSLTDVTIPDTVQEIGTNVFGGCSNLTSLTVPFVGASREDSRSLGYFFSPAFVLETSGKTYQAYNLPDRLSTVRVTDATEIAEEAFYAFVFRSSNDRTKIQYLNSIVLNDGITTIGANAFRDQSALTSLTLPKNLQTIGVRPFQGCTGLQSIVFPDTLTQIPDQMFYGCSGLKSYSIPPQVTKIGNLAFQNCSGLTEFTIPDTVQEIGEKVFGGCSNLTSLTVPFVGANREDSRSLGYFFSPAFVLETSGKTYQAYNLPDRLSTVRVTDATEIAEEAFYSFVFRSINDRTRILHLSSIILNDGVTAIGANAFRDQSELVSFHLPASLTTIGDHPFSGCSKLQSFDFPENMTQIPDYLFAGCGLLEFAIPAQVTSIGTGAFQGCGKLSTFSIPPRVTVIGPYAFSSCTSLRDVTIPNTVQEIGTNVFGGCSNLTSLTVPFVGASREDSRSLGYFFSQAGFTVSPTNSSSDTHIAYNIPDRLSTVRVTDATEIAEEAFYAFVFRSFNDRTKIQHLSSIILNDGITTIGANAFRDQSELVSFHLPDSLTTVGKSPFTGCTTLQSFDFPEALTQISDQMFSGCSGLKSFSIPPQVTKIGNQAFSSCSSLIEFTIPDTVQEIGEKVFSGCSNLTSLTVPFVGANREDSRSLGYFFSPAFVLETSGKTYQAYNLPDRLSTVRVTDATEIAEEAFYAYVYRSSYDRYTILRLSSIILNDGVTAIGANAFRDQSKLTCFYFPASLSTIGGSAFSGCSGLTEAFYPCTMDEWLDVTIATGNNILYSIPIRCSDGVLLNGEEIEDPDAGADAASPEDPAESADGESGGSIGPVEPVIEPVPTEAPDPVTEPTPTEDPDPAVEPAPSEEPAPVIAPAPTEDPGYIGLASFSGESAPVDDTVYAASFAGLVPGEQYVLLITGEDVADLDLRFASLLFIAQGAAGEDGTLRFSYVRLPSETAPVIRLYGRSDKDLGDAEALGLVMHKGVSDPKAYSVHVSYEGTELKENEDFILSMEKRANGIIAVTVKGIRAYSGSRTVLAKETCLEAAETPDGYAIIHTAHTWGEWSESTATCEEPGEKARSCSVCGKTERESTEPIGHLWGEPVWTWSEDLASAEASFTCAHDSSHVTTLEASVTPDGEDEYGVFHTAAVVFEGKTYTDSRYLRLYLPGDLNRDREVDSRDLLRLRQMLVGTETLSPAADLNGDGTVDILDLVRFRKYLAGEDVILFDPKG